MGGSFAHPYFFWARAGARALNNNTCYGSNSAGGNHRTRCVISNAFYSNAFYSKQI